MISCLGFNGAWTLKRLASVFFFKIKVSFFKFPDGIVKRYWAAEHIVTF